MIPYLNSAKGQKRIAVKTRNNRSLAICLTITSTIILITWLHTISLIGVSAASYSIQFQSQNTNTLTPGEVIERELVGEVVHHYQFSLPSGNYLRLSVEQKGVAIVSSLFGPGGEKLIEADYLGKKSLSIIAPFAEGKPSTYRVEIRARVGIIRDSQAVTLSGSKSNDWPWRVIRIALKPKGWLPTPLN
jgi:hypothetical protein